MSFLVALRKEWTEQWRSYRFLITAAVFTFFGLASPALAKFTPELLKLVPGIGDIASVIPAPTLADAVGQYLKNISQFGILLALLLSMGSVAQEKDKGTAAMILCKPLPRSAFLAAKVAALGLNFAISLLLAGAGAYYYTLLLFGPLDVSAWLGLNALMLVYLMVYAALTVCFSVISRSQAVAGGLGFAALVVLGGLGAFPTLGKYLPDYLLTWGGQMALSGGEPGWAALALSLGLIVAAGLAAWLIFRRQEL